MRAALSGIAVILALLRASSAWACVCYETSLAEAIASSDAIFLGRVVAVGPGTMEIAGEAEEATKATFEVERSWKGEPLQRTEVVTCGTKDMVCTCGLSFEVGERFVVMAGRWPKDSPSALLYADSCTRTKPANESEKLIKALDKALPKAKPARRPTMR